MDKLTVTATVRTTTGKRAAKVLRATGILPAVMYNGKGEATMLQVNEAEFTKVWKQATPTTLIELVVGKDKYTATVQLLQVEAGTQKEMNVEFKLV